MTRAKFPPECYPRFVNGDQPLTPHAASLSEQDAARYLGVAHRTLLRMEAEGELRREPGTQRFKRADLKSWRDRHRAADQVRQSAARREMEQVPREAKETHDV